MNSHGNPDLRHSAHGHRPEHLVFFLCKVNDHVKIARLLQRASNTYFLHRSQARLTLVLSLSSLLLFAGGSLEPASGGDVAAPLSGT